MKSPLLIVGTRRQSSYTANHFQSTHLATISDETLSILKNTEIIAINQDPVVGTGVVPFRWGLNVRPNAHCPSHTLISVAGLHLQHDPSSTILERRGAEWDRRYDDQHSR